MKKVYYNIGGGILEVIIRDETGAKIDHFKMNLSDSKTQRSVFSQIQYKYGLEIFGKGFFDF